MFFLSGLETYSVSIKGHGTVVLTRLLLVAFDEVPADGAFSGLCGSHNKSNLLSASLLSLDQSEDTKGLLFTRSNKT